MKGRWQQLKEYAGLYQSKHGREQGNKQSQGPMDCVKDAKPGIYKPVSLCITEYITLGILPTIKLLEPGQQSMYVRIATTKNARQSTTHDTVLIKTEIYYHQRNTPHPQNKIYTPGRTGDYLKKLQGRTYMRGQNMADSKEKKVEIRKRPNKLTMRG